VKKMKFVNLYPEYLTFELDKNIDYPPENYGKTRTDLNGKIARQTGKEESGSISLKVRFIKE